MALNGVGALNQRPFTSAPTGESAQVGFFALPARTPSPFGAPPAQNANRLWYHLNRSLLQLRTEAANLARPDLWNAKTATSSDASLVAATAQAETAAGTYAIGVTALATAEKLGSRAVGTTVTPLGVSGTFTLNGRAIAVEATDTLTTLANKIGQSGANVQAKVETASEGGYRLTLTANTTGQAGALALSDTTPGTLAGLGLTTAEGQKANVLQAARDAAFTVNGEQRTSGTNKPVVGGLALELKQTTAAPVTVSVAVAYDEEALVAAARKFAEAYNAAQGELDRMSLTGGSGSRAAAMNIQRDLAGALQGTGRGAVAAGGVRPREAGFRLGPSGTLSFDEDAFRKALATDREGVAQAFTTPGGAAARVGEVLAPLTGRVNGYDPSQAAAPAASWVKRQLFAGLTQGATPRELELNRQAAVLHGSLALLGRQHSTLTNQANALFAPLS